MLNKALVRLAIQDYLGGYLTVTWRQWILKKLIFDTKNIYNQLQEIQIKLMENVTTEEIENYFNEYFR